MKIFESKKNYNWEVDDFHKWSERSFFFKYPPKKIFSKNTNIVAMGSCFASEVVKYLDRYGYKISAHPNGLLYNTFTIRDHLEHLFSAKSPYHNIKPEKLGNSGYRHPYKKVTPKNSYNEALEYDKSRDELARDAWRKAEVIIITLGLTEVWLDSATNLAEIEIPHPTRYKKDRYEFFRSTFEQNLENLKKAYQIIREFSQAPIILSVSPVPLYATFSTEDVTVANCLSKSILRAVASELTTQYDDIYYFPSFEMVMYSMDPKKFMKEDGRHVSEEGVSKIMEYFLSIFGDSSLDDLKKEEPEKQSITMYGIDSAILKKPKAKLSNRIASKINCLLKPLGIRIMRL